MWKEVNLLLIERNKCPIIREENAEAAGPPMVKENKNKKQSLLW